MYIHTVMSVMSVVLVVLVVSVLCVVSVVTEISVELEFQFENSELQSEVCAWAGGWV